MANQDAAFGLRAIGKVGQNRDNQGLSEYTIAQNEASTIYQNDPVIITATVLGEGPVVNHLPNEVSP